MSKNRPILNLSSGYRQCAIGCIRISFGSINKKIIFLFIKKFFYKNKIKNKIATRSNLYNLNGALEDRTIIIYFKKPNSYTGDDLLEVYCHGSLKLLKNTIYNFCLYLKLYSVKLSKKGEFTKRAYLNKKLSISDINDILNIYNYRKKFNDIKTRNRIIKLVNSIKTNILKKDLLGMDNSSIILNNIFYLKNIILSLINNRCDQKDNSKNLLIIGSINVGKSTLINKFLKISFSIISLKKGSTKNLIEKIINFNGVKFNIIDTPGFCKIKNNIEYLNFIKSISLIEYSKIIIYMKDTYRNYDYFLYYIVGKIVKSQLIFRINNKADKFFNLIYFEIHVIKKIKYFIFKISSILEYGIDFILNEIKRNHYIISKYYKNFFLKILKKSYKKIQKCVFLFFKKESTFLLNEIKSLNKLLSIFLGIKSKCIFNKLIKGFCVGK